MAIAGRIALLLAALVLCCGICLISCDDFPNQQTLNNPCTDASVQFFFSPFNSMGAYIDVIRNAKHTLDIYTPGIGSSQGCHTKGCKVIDSSMQPVEYQETFPIFHELLSAMRRGVRIRILTDGSTTKYFRKDRASPAQFLYIAGAEIQRLPDGEQTVVGPGLIDIRLLRTAYHKQHQPNFFGPRTVFQHAKVVLADYASDDDMDVDMDSDESTIDYDTDEQGNIVLSGNDDAKNGGEATLISAVNWSQGGFFENADQGVVVRNCHKVAELVYNSFESDWREAKQDYKCECDYPAFGKEAIQSIKNAVVKKFQDESDWYKPAWNMPYPNLHLKTKIKTVIAHPDGTLFDSDERDSYALVDFIDKIYNANKKVEVMMYEMEYDNVCRLFLREVKDSPDVEFILRVSHRVVGKRVSNNPCYEQLVGANLNNLKVYMQDGSGKGLGGTDIQYEHEKFWIIDDEIVMTSTGNWKSKDMPDRQLNEICYRGFSIGFEDPRVVQIFKVVIDNIGGTVEWVHQP